MFVRPEYRHQFISTLLLDEVLPLLFTFLASANIFTVQVHLEIAIIDVPAFWNLQTHLFLPTGTKDGPADETCIDPRVGHNLQERLINSPIAFAPDAVKAINCPRALFTHFCTANHFASGLPVPIRPVQCSVLHGPTRPGASQEQPHFAALGTGSLYSSLRRQKSARRERHLHARPLRRKHHQQQCEQRRQVHSLGNVVSVVCVEAPLLGSKKD